MRAATAKRRPCAASRAMRVSPPKRCLRSFRKVRLKRSPKFLASASPKAASSSFDIASTFFGWLGTYFTKQSHIKEQFYVNSTHDRRSTQTDDRSPRRPQGRLHLLE